MTAFENSPEQFGPTDNSEQGGISSADVDYNEISELPKNDIDEKDNAAFKEEGFVDFSETGDIYAPQESNPVETTQLAAVSTSSDLALYRNADLDNARITSIEDAQAGVSSDADDGKNKGEEAKAEVKDGKPVDPGKVDKFDFADESLKMFSDLDINGNGNLSQSELKKAMLDPKYKGKQAQTVAALFEAGRNGPLKNMVRGDGIGISRQDLKEMDHQAEHGMAAFRAGRADKFIADEKISGEDGKLSREEITRALERDDLSERDLTNLKFLHENYDLIDDDGDGIDKGELKSYSREQFENKGMKVALQAENNINWVHSEQVSENPKELYANSDNPLESIQDPEAIRQTGPSCFFEASVLAVAQAEPETIKNMIKPNDDGTFTVTFPGDSDNPVTIQPPTEAEMGEFHDSAAAGRWGNILQKAHGQYLQDNYFRRHFHDVDGGDIPAEGAHGGEARLGQTMKLLTGRDFDRDGFSITPGLAKTTLEFSSSEAEMREKLSINLEGDSKAPVVASTSKPAHVYAITGFDSQGPDGGTITYIDPLGGGRDTMSVQEALKKFNAISYSEKPGFIGV